MASAKKKEGKKRKSPLGAHLELWALPRFPCLPRWQGTRCLLMLQFLGPWVTVTLISAAAYHAMHTGPLCPAQANLVPQCTLWCHSGSKLFSLKTQALSESLCLQSFRGVISSVVRTYSSDAGCSRRSENSYQASSFLCFHALETT